MAECTPGPTGTVPAPAAPSELLMPWGTADEAAAAPSPSHYLVRAAARGLFLALHHFPANAAASLPLSCHAPHARPSSHALARVCTPTVPGLLGRLCHTCQPSASPCQPPALLAQPITSHQGSWR